MKVIVYDGIEPAAAAINLRKPNRNETTLNGDVVSLTMSAGVLLVIVKVLPVLGGFHTDGGHQYFRSSSPLLLENAAESSSVLAEGSPVSAGTEVVETCSGASSSLLHNHFVDYSPELTDKF